MRARKTATPMAIPTAAPTPSPFSVCAGAGDVAAVLLVGVVEISDARYSICNIGTTAENVETTAVEDEVSDVVYGIDMYVIRLVPAEQVTVGKVEEVIVSMQWGPL